MKNKVISTEYVEKNYISKDIIKKQQKEIEDLKNDHIDFWINTKEVEDIVRGKFINKDKIKEEIELLKDIKKANCYKQITTEDYLKGAIEQLEELLGE